MNIVVTGSEGFVATHFRQRMWDRFGNDHKIICVDKKLGRDLSDARTIQWLKEVCPNPDFVISFAGTCSTPRGFTHPEEAFHDNAEAMLNVLQYCVGTKAQLIHTSTIKAQPADEGMYTPYGLTKLFGEMLVFEWMKSFGLKAIVNRPGTIYGPGQHGSAESGWLGWFITAALEGKTVTVNGDGNQIRDILFVEDYVDLVFSQMVGFDEYMAKAKGKAYVVGGGNDNALSLNEAIQVIQRYLPLTVQYGPTRLGDNRRLVSPNIVSFVRLWKPKTSARKGIGDTIKFYKENKDNL